MVKNTHDDNMKCITNLVMDIFFNCIAEEEDTNGSIVPCYLVRSSTLRRTPGSAWAGVVRPVEPRGPRGVGAHRTLGEGRICNQFSYHLIYR